MCAQALVPPSKSHTNRALLAAALAGGKSTLRHLLKSDDTRWMMRALVSLGVKIHESKDTVEVRGGEFLTTPRDKKTGAIFSRGRRIFCGNAGTAMRFLTAVLSAFPFETTLDGDSRMRQRPIGDLGGALNQLGAQIEFLQRKGFPSLRVRGPLEGGICRIKGNISSQFLSGLLLAAPLAQNSVTILVEGELVSKPYADMTIRVMETFGVEVRREGYRKFFIRSGQRYQPTRITMEGDASAASYFWGIAALTGEQIEIENIPKNSIQADMQLSEILFGKSTGGPVKKTSPFLQTFGPIKIHAADFPDSAMTLAVLAAFRKGSTRLTGLSNLRLKECDRLHALATELRKIGAKTKELTDGLLIRGNPEQLHPARIQTYHDHRMAMCFGMAGFVLPGMKIENPSCVKKTYPDYWRNLSRLKEQFREKNIILTGMRGSGKSRLGALLGRRLGRRFIDLDEQIERMAGKTVAEIVAAKGWKYFRLIETRAVKKAAAMRHAVIATGGGTLMTRGNAELLRKHGRIIYLSCTLPSLKKRLQKNTARPSLTGKNFLEELSNVLKKREPTYTAYADTMINVTGETHDKKADLERKTELLLKAASRLGLL